MFHINIPNINTIYKQILYFKYLCDVNKDLTFFLYESTQHDML